MRRLLRERRMTTETIKRRRNKRSLIGINLYQAPGVCGVPMLSRPAGTTLTVDYQGCNACALTILLRLFPEISIIQNKAETVQ